MKRVTQSDLQIPALGSPAVTDHHAAARTNHRSGGERATLALLLAAAAVALSLFPAFSYGLEMVVGLQHMRPAQRLETSGQTAPSASPTPVVLSTAPEVEAQLAALNTSVAELRKIAEEGPDAERLQAFEQDVSAMKQQISLLDQRVSMAVAPDVAALLAARLALLSVNRGLRPDDLDAITSAAAADPVMAEAVANLKVLVEQNIPPVSLLRERFPGLAQNALLQASRAGLGWWDSGVFAVHSTLSRIGVGHGTDETRDSLVIAEVERNLDLGRLQQALFELDAGSAELKSLMSGWINDAKQRMALDDGLLQLVNLLLARIDPAARAG